MAAELAGVPVLVTGGTGFIGSHLVRRLVREGALVHVLARDKGTPWRLADVLSKVTVWNGHLADQGSLDRVMSESGAAVVYHLGADTAGQQWTATIDEFRPAVAVNLVGTLNLVQAAHRRADQVRRLIRFGSLVEHAASPSPFVEAQREAPNSAYAASLVATTAFLEALAGRLRFPVVTLRLTSVYGPARATDYFVPSLIVHCLDGRDFTMSSGEQLWDFIHVDDIVEACLRAAVADVAPVDLFNIGAGVGYRLLDVAETIVRLTGAATRLHRTRPGDGDLFCSNERARARLDWAPRIDLDTGLQRTIAWYRDHRHEPGLAVASLRKT